MLKAVGFEAYGAAAARSRVQLFTMTLWPSQETKKETAGEPTFFLLFSYYQNCSFILWFSLRFLQKLVSSSLGCGKKGFHSTKVNCILTYCVLIAGLQKATRNDFFSNFCPISLKTPIQSALLPSI